MSTNTALDQIKARVEGRTDGPWEIEEGDEAWEVRAPEGSITWDDHGGEVFRNRADAELIAAAPKLLAALEAVEELADGMNCASKDHVYGTWDHGYNTALRSAATLIREVIEEVLR